MKARYINSPSYRKTSSVLSNVVAWAFIVLLFAAIIDAAFRSRGL